MRRASRLGELSEPIRTDSPGPSPLGEGRRFTRNGCCRGWDSYPKFPALSTGMKRTRMCSRVPTGGACTST